LGKRKIFKSILKNIQSKVERNFPFLKMDQNLLKQSNFFISTLKNIQGKVERNFPSIKMDQNFLKQSNFFIKTLTWGLIASTGFVLIWIVFAYTDEVVLVNGKLEPIGDVKKIQIPVGGVIKEILVKSGDKVTAGQILIVLDKEISQQNLGSLENQFNQKNLQLALKKQEKNKTIELYKERINVLQKRLEIQKKILKKFQFLLDEGAIAELKYLEEVNRENEIIGKIIDNQKDLQRRKLILEQDIKIIDAELSALLAKKTEAKVLLDYKSLKSPVDGLVFDLKPTSSGFVAQSSEPIMKIVPFNNLEADIKIPSSKIGFVKLGMPVDISIDSFPANDFGSLKGRIESIGSDVLELDKNSPPFESYFPGRIKLNSQTLKLSNGRILPLQVGMSLKANIKLRRVSYLKLLLGTFKDKSDSLKQI
jgi:HlyD family secretion protein